MAVRAGSHQPGLSFTYQPGLYPPGAVCYLLSAICWRTELKLKPMAGRPLLDIIRLLSRPALKLRNGQVERVGRPTKRIDEKQARGEHGRSHWPQFPVDVPPVREEGSARGWPTGEP